VRTRARLVGPVDGSSSQPRRPSRTLRVADMPSRTRAPRVSRKKPCARRVLSHVDGMALTGVEFCMRKARVSVGEGHVRCRGPLVAEPCSVFRIDVARGSRCTDAHRARGRPRNDVNARRERRSKGSSRRTCTLGVPARGQRPITEASCRGGVGSAPPPTKVLAAR